MSFSGTPLGQGRRLDHNTFLGKPTSNGNAAPASYAYGAPTLGSRSPPKTTSSLSNSRHTLQEQEHENENETALARFARLKQQESVLNSVPHPGAPKVITSPPKPEKWSVKDTSVNIATAFTQAATDMSATYTNPNNSWASTSRTNLNVPRSTSVEYEATAPTAFNRKHLAPPPPDRLGRVTTTARKPPSKTPSIRHVPDSEGEEDGRGKSPFERVVDLGKQALSQATFYVRQRSMSREPEEPSIEQRPAINGNGNDSSYDYAEEEEAYQATQHKRHNIPHRRGRISVDNKAYKPPLSESESELSDDGKTRRKKKKKGGPTGGPLSTLPILSADKTKKKRKKNPKKNLETQEDESESEEHSQYMEIQSLQRTSVSRNSNPPVSQITNSHMPQELSSYDDGDVSMEGAEQGLHSIPEVDELLLLDDPPPQQPQRYRSRTPAPRSPAPTSAFSIGGLLGSIVHYIVKILISLFSAVVSFLSLISFVCGHVAGTIYDIILRRPGNWLSGINSGSFLKYFALCLTILGAWYALHGVSLTSSLPSMSFPSRSGVYRAPEVPAGNVAELSERLRRMESAVSSLSADTDRTSGRGYSELLGRLSALEARFTETRKVLDADAKARDLVGRSMNGVKHDMEILQSQIVAQQVRHEREQREDVSDLEARAKLKVLEERVGTVEGGMKEAFELGKKSFSTPAPSPGPVSAWWNKLLTNPNSKIQIKSSDGQDVTALIHHLVDSAVSTITQDIVAKPDFAHHSGGARVIPSLTSPTFAIMPQTLGSQMIALVTGSGYASGRAAITALHHEMHNGHCWPFIGGEGQLGVALASPIFVEEVTIDHVAKSIAFDMRSAPRQMEVWGLVEGKDNIARVQAWKEEKAARREAGQSSGSGEQSSLDGDYEVVYPKTLPKYPEYIRLASFTYDIHSSNNVQTFPVMPEIRELGIDFGIVVLRVLNNWGRNEFTCLYRFRVHGQRMGEIPPPYSEDVQP